jgi:hypothetical protein
MTYYSISPELKRSCYNCRYFELGADMLHGNCPRFGRVSATGTCNHFCFKPMSLKMVKEVQTTKS